MSKSCLDTVVDLARRDDRILIVGTEPGTRALREFMADHPWRCYQEGAKEQHLVGMAAGLARDGGIVYAHAPAASLARRAYEQVALDVCQPGVNVRLIGTAAGGQAVDDVALMRALPGMTVLCPADADEAGRMIRATVDHQGPVYLRLPAVGGQAAAVGGEPVGIGRAVRVCEGGDALLLTTGAGLHACVTAADLLKGNGVQVGILHLPTVKPLDEQAVRSAVERVAVVVTVEEHSVVGGLGSAAAELLAESDLLAGRRFRRVGVPDVSPGRQAVSAENVAGVVLAMVEQACGGARRNHGTRAA